MARAKTIAGEPGVVLLSQRQRDLLLAFRVGEDGIVRYAGGERLPDWAQVKKVFASQGAQWMRKAQGFAFPTDVEPGEALAQLIATGKMQDAGVVGFFATPAELADRVVESANLPDMRMAGRKLRVLEPSAGKGALIAALRRRHGDQLDIDYCELLPTHRAELAREHPQAQLMTDDFLGWLPPGPYDAVIMNPPFAGRGDARHVRHAWDHALKPGGRLAAIMGAGVLYRDDAVTREVRALFQLHGSLVRLPADSFKESGTSVATVLGLADKPALAWKD